VYMGKSIDVISAHTRRAAKKYRKIVCYYVYVAVEQNRQFVL
jgi:hypothetical protein